LPSGTSVQPSRLESLKLSLKVKVAGPLSFAEGESSLPTGASFLPLIVKTRSCGAESPTFTE
jgi:hypothetical protein